MIDARRFVEAVTPLLEAKDLDGLLSHLRANYQPEQLTALLAESEHADAQKVAALALGLVGGRCAIPCIARRLQDPDPMTNQMAEHALWSIWFRCGAPEANAELAFGTDCLSDRRYECAFDHFNRALEISPDFAEVYNQRAIALYLQERYADSASDCRRAVELMPCHFGAWAGLGHCHAHMGRLCEALSAYEQALEINPHLDCVRQAVEELRKQIRA